MPAAMPAQPSGTAAAVRSECPSPSPTVPSSSLRSDDAPPADPAGAAAARVYDVRDVVWTEGVARLRRLTGKPDRATRSLMGRLLKNAADDCALVLGVLGQAEMDRPGDPEPWLMATIDVRMGRRRGEREQAEPRWGWKPMFAPGARASDDIIDMEAEV